MSGRDSPASFGGRKASRGLASRESEASRPLPPPPDVRPARRGSGSLGSAPRRLSLSGGEAPARQPSQSVRGAGSATPSGPPPPLPRSVGSRGGQSRRLLAGLLGEKRRGEKAEKTKAKKKLWGALGLLRATPKGKQWRRRRWGGGPVRHGLGGRRGHRGGGGSVGEGLHLLLLLLLADPGFQALPNPSWAGKEFKASALFSLPVCADKPGAKTKNQKNPAKKAGGVPALPGWPELWKRRKRRERRKEGKKRRKEGKGEPAGLALATSRSHLPSFSSRSDARRPGPFPAQAMDPRRRGKGWVAGWGLLPFAGFFFFLHGC